MSKDNEEGKKIHVRFTSSKTIYEIKNPEELIDRIFIAYMFGKISCDEAISILCVKEDF